METLENACDECRKCVNFGVNCIGLAVMVGCTDYIESCDGDFTGDLDSQDYDHDDPIPDEDDLPPADEPDGEEDR